MINFLRRGHQQPSIARFLSDGSDFKLSGKLKVVHNNSGKFVWLHSGSEFNVLIS